ncbi:cysteine methyltransferase [Sphingomonas sp. Leaf357]|uniref:methylated-DNA--[protein]-cysteine S-methyltransferase n=1 Tax=Sphingomonas sp. Leaf357 TaxID=1736350 RepID=UPI0006FA2EB7|nr:methylated-DNA--[protein]-cysteine S-methyltransferase [Sphingomonas sp. Leaf357]KQS03206.1 cysteine methyltransferase [Sphingomonas sp. Leaf357]
MYARDIAEIATPIGMVRIIGHAQAVESIEIGSAITDEIQPLYGAVAAAADQMRAWFAGELRLFDLSLVPPATPRGPALRDAMIAIPYGETMGYGELARTIGSSARAIGQACARNPFPIVVPCHRVLDASGSLGHYSAGAGPITKSRLLDHERRFSGRTLL